MPVLNAADDLLMGAEPVLEVRRRGAIVWERPGVPVNTSPPVVSGATTTGDTAVATPGTWTNSPTSYAYQWQVDPGTGWENVPGETAALFEVEEAGEYRVRVIASNAAGASDPAYSAPFVVTEPSAGIIQQSDKLRLSSGSLPHTFSNAFPSMPATGRDVIAIVAWYGPAPSSVTIAGATAVLDADHTPNGDQYRLLVYRARVGGTPNRNITFNGSGTVWITAAVIEINALPSSPVDQIGTSFEWVPAEAPVSVSTPSPTSQANELVIAAWTNYASSVSDLQGSEPASPGYTTLWTEQNHATYMGGNASYKFVDATGVQTATWTRNNEDRAPAIIVTYRI